MTLDGAFTHLVSFNTDRLRIRQMRLSDAGAVFSFKSDFRVTDLYGQEPPRTIDESKGWLQRRVNDYALRDSIFCVITCKGDDIAIGECCLWNFDPGFHCAENGYELHSKYWNKGLMGEALSEVLAYGFLEMGLHRIEASPFMDNIRSHNILRARVQVGRHTARTPFLPRSFSGPAVLWSVERGMERADDWSIRTLLLFRRVPIR